MVKSVSNSYRQGLRDWLIQRISAMIIALCSVALAVYFYLHPNLSFAEWHGLYTSPWVKVVSILFILSILFHAWVGVWTIITDYVKPYVLRLILHICVFLTLLSSLIWVCLILWSV